MPTNKSKRKTLLLAIVLFFDDLMISYLFPTASVTGWTRRDIMIIFLFPYEVVFGYQVVSAASFFEFLAAQA
jgi:hypothetical protein